jgi:hypothetical protein
MSDSLRDRIATVIYAHDCWDYAGGLECRCGSQFTFDDSDVNGDAIKPWADHVADAVIAELGLEEESLAGGYCTRHVTQWHLNDTPPKGQRP